MDKKKRKKWNARELFIMIDEGLREKGLRPEKILDYSNAGSATELLLSEEFDVVPYVVHGSCEGIYMTILLETGDNAQVFSSHKPRLNLGTYKTLNTDKESYMKMAMLGAEFVFALRDYVNDHMDEFNWTGFDLWLFRAEKDPAGKMWVYSHERAVERASQFIGRQSGSAAFAVIRNNETEKEETIRCGEMTA